MPWSYERDPVTGDLIPDGRGGWRKIETAANLVRNQMLARAGECWQDPELGSRLHDRERFKANAAVLVQDECRRVLARVEAVGRIANVEVVAAQTRSGRIDVNTRFVDLSSGQVVSLKLPVGG